MSLFEFIRLVYRNLKFLIIIPVVLALTVFLLTGNGKKEYKSSALIYTGIASGYNIESGANDRTDYHQLNAAYDNLITIFKSRFTLQEVGLRLLSLHLIQSEPNEVLGPTGYNELMEVFPAEKRSEFVVENDFEKTLINIQILLRENHPLIRKLIFESSSYSIEKLSKIEVKRIKSSDMLELSFKTHDPGICQSTLKVLIEVFSEKYKTIKESETGDVVAYFNKELLKAKDNLNRAEQELTDFRVESRVINYGEETKALAIKKQNALEEFAIKKMNLKGTEAALDEIEKKLAEREVLLSQNIDLLEEKRRLAAVTTTLASLELGQNEDTLSVMKLKREQNEVRQKINGLLNNVVKLTTSKEGTSSRQLVNEWLDNVIQLNRERVTVALYQSRLNDIDQQYDNFTPMGSNIDRLERQIGVYEREYLEVLHGLNMSKLRQQNIEMTSNLETIDPPSYPLDSEASKRMLMVIVAGLFGGFATLATVVAKELLDTTLSNPEKATRDTGLEVAGAFPVIDEHFKRVADQQIISQICGLILGKLNIESRQNSASKITAVTGVVPEVGVRTISKILQQEILSSGQSCLLVMPGDKKSVDLEKHRATYVVTKSLNSIKSIEQLVSIDPSSFDRIIFVLPHLSSGILPIDLVNKIDIPFIVYRADKGWGLAQKNLTQNLKKITGQNPLLILNGMKVYHLDQIIVNVPIKRHPLINKLKEFAKFEFSSRTLKTSTK